MLDLERSKIWDKIFKELQENSLNYKITPEGDIEFSEIDVEKGFEIIQKYLPEYKSN